MKTIFAGAFGLAAITLSLAGPALAGPRDDVLYGISRCGGISDDRSWLDCVYGAAQPMRAQLGLSPAPAAQQKLVPPSMPGMAAPSYQNFSAQAAPEPKAGFLEQMITPKHDAPEQPTTLASYKFDGAGFFDVTLANGETWYQNSGDTARARWNKAAKSYTAQILPSSTDSKRLKVGTEIFLVDRGK